MKTSRNYETVIGLEVHAQLLTKSKMFAPEETSYGQSPNSKVSFVTLAHPGTLPTINKEGINHAIKMVLACKGNISYKMHFDRKNYFYPDLPKGYQITQEKTPIGKNGVITISLKKKEKKIRIKRIHIEEDTGKSLYDLLPNKTLLDYNRAGTPLLEIVSEADMKTPNEAYQYLQEIRQMLRYLEICDGNMDEGSMRCDANISVMEKGSSTWGTRVEIKNMNSIRNVEQALSYEIKRQISCLESGGKIFEETRSFDAQKGVTNYQRKKETLSEYRYFPEPNLPSITLNKSLVESIKESMPLLPRELLQKFTNTYKVSSYDATLLTSDKSTALFFESLYNLLPKKGKDIVNWIIGPIKSYLNDNKISLEDFPLSTETVTKLIKLTSDDVMSFSTASQDLLPELIKFPKSDPQELALKMGLIQTDDKAQLNDWIDQALENHPEEVKRYKNGKKGLLGFFMGAIMELSGKKANPKITNNILIEKLESHN